MNGEGAQGGKKLLVVDDDPISLQIAALLLATEGFVVEQAESGEEALEELAQNHEHPEVMLVDLQMPGICGNALAARLREATGAHLIAMSATEPSAGQVAGYDGFVLKPLDQAALREIAGGGAPKKAADLESTGNDDEAVLDLAVLAKLQKAMPPSAVAEVFDACLSDTRRRTAAMRAMSAAGDMSAVRAAAHTIKGGAAMVGAVRIATLAAGLELNVYQKDDVPPKLDELLSACDEAERILFRYTTTD